MRFEITGISEFCDAHPEQVDTHLSAPEGEFSRAIGAAVELRCSPGSSPRTGDTVQVKCIAQDQETGRWTSDNGCQGMQLQLFDLCLIAYSKT